MVDVQADQITVTRPFKRNLLRSGPFAETFYQSDDTLTSSIQLHPCFVDKCGKGLQSGIVAHYCHSSCYESVGARDATKDIISAALYDFSPSSQWQRERESFWVDKMASWFYDLVTPHLPLEMWRMIASDVAPDPISLGPFIVRRWSALSHPEHRPDAIEVPILVRFGSRSLENKRYVSHVVRNSKKESSPIARGYLWVGSDCRGIVAVHFERPEVEQDIWWQRIRLEQSKKLRLAWDVSSFPSFNSLLLIIGLVP
ncbi:hypothetical protein BDY21DRAFT_128416 [Lineolata rhizophorae]|uniref:Uncharacterized protein n=1 Tax=Lineolata rhizophorae TaxID=578093 RepID=A0A6A6NPH2_9PEZI|nr:hypothetical protein BDY21DRAFT_128416 [Lineolata rhizophorae]